MRESKPSLLQGSILNGLSFIPTMPQAAVRLSPAYYALDVPDH